MRNNSDRTVKSEQQQLLFTSMKKASSILYILAVSSVWILPFFASVGWAQKKSAPLLKKFSLSSLLLFWLRFNTRMFRLLCSLLESCLSRQRPVDWQIRFGIRLE